MIIKNEDHLQKLLLFPKVLEIYSFHFILNLTYNQIFYFILDFSSKFQSRSHAV